MRIESQELPIIDPSTNKAAAWEVDIQLGRNPNGGEAVCIVRPRFDRWALDVLIGVDQREIAPATIRELFDLAADVRESRNLATM